MGLDQHGKRSECTYKTHTHTHTHTLLACIDDDVCTHPWMYLPAQAVSSNKFASLSTSIKITKGVKGDLRNQSIVRNHHSNGAEQGFQVIWELRASCVARIHGDEAIACHFELKFGALKFKHLQTCCFGSLDCQDLLCNHTEHL